MQAILVADYSFSPIEYWRGVSEQGESEARRRALRATADAVQRETSSAAA